ncbi:MAG: pyruvate dehydrogenase (acetyl-transferring) E1 component subunit alpha [Planctomycetota bacterium]|nr:MAG: pyruvate dehydrogenase (acetyl-transferring) E1 component subunit alpha [Planctomycetota bacterium]
MTTAAASTRQTGARPRKRLTDSLPDETLIGWLRDMTLIREFEVRTMQAYSNAKIGGFCHVYIGEEACAVGTLACVNPDDPVITAYRDHGHALARGMDPGACMAEMFGRITGCAKGKGGSMHMFDRPHWLFGGHGIVGAQTPLGAGLAFAAKYQREVLGQDQKKVALCYLGDGALNQGAFHEAMNLAGLFGLPVIYIVENNRYSMGTEIHRGTTMADDLPKKAAAYGVEGVTIDGMDVLEVYDRFKPIADACREEVRPAFVDLHTYRYHGHSMSDPQKYRAKEEVEEVKQRDSIDLLAAHLIEERKALTPDDRKAMQQEIKKIVRDAVRFAEESPEPPVEPELYSDVYLNPQPGLSPIREYTRGAKNPLL